MNNENSKTEPYDPFKADVYSLAKIVSELLGEELNQNGHPFYSLIRDMKNEIPKLRPSFLDILNRLSQMKINAEEPLDEEKYIEMIRIEKINDKKTSPQEKIGKLLNLYDLYYDLPSDSKIDHLEECEKIIKLNGGPDEFQKNFDRQNPCLLLSFYLKVASREMKKRDFDRAMIYHNKCLEILNREDLNKTDEDISQVYNSIANNYFKLSYSDNTEENLKRRMEAESFYKKSLEFLANKSHLKHLLAETHEALAIFIDTLGEITMK